MISSRCNAASTDRMPDHGAAFDGVDALFDDLQADAAVAQCAPRVIRCSTDLPRRSRRLMTMVSPWRAMVRTRASFGRDAFAPLGQYQCGCRSRRLRRDQGEPM